MAKSKLKFCITKSEDFCTQIRKLFLNLGTYVNKIWERSRIRHFPKLIWTASPTLYVFCLVASSSWRRLLVSNASPEITAKKTHFVQNMLKTRGVLLTSFSWLVIEFKKLPFLIKWVNTKKFVWRSFSFFLGLSKNQIKLGSNGHLAYKSFWKPLPCVTWMMCVKNMTYCGPCFHWQKITGQTWNSMVKYPEGLVFF